MTARLQLLEGIAALDGQLSPTGLYGADRGLVFTKVIYPAFKAQRFRVASWSKTGKYASLEPEDGGDASRLDFVALSKIKVRLFGNRFAVDPHVGHEDRWDQKRMEKLLSRLWAAGYEHSKYVVLVGYDIHPEPFASELRRLNDSIDWTSRGAAYETMSWTDPHKRGFFTRACFWSAPVQGP